MDEPVSFGLVLRAAETIQGQAHVTPVMASRQLDDLISGKVFLKCENFQRTGAFKFRGAFHALSNLTSNRSKKIAVTLSSGNHGQGLALAARLLGFMAYVVMPQPVSSLKQRAVEGYGGIVGLTADRQSAEEKVREITDDGAVYVHAFNDPDVIAGQGTIMLELLAQVDELDVILAPVGGGGLLSGLCIAGHHLRPRMKLFGCEPDGAWDAAESIRLNRILPMPNPTTMADGLRTSLGTRTLPILRAHLEKVFRVSEEEILQAMRFAYERLKIVIEPSAAVALAPVLRAEVELVGKRIGIVLTGGNSGFDERWSLSE
jgi:threonine dehydratase